MVDAVQVEEGESQSDVVTDVDLDVVGDRLGGAFQKVGQAVVHQKYRKASVWVLVCTQSLDYVWVPYGAQELALLLKPPHR